MVQNLLQQSQRWQVRIWFGVSLGLLLTIVMLLLIVGITIWRTLTLVDAHISKDPILILASMNVINITMLRLLSVLVGAAISFSGLAVSFFAHEKATSFRGELNAAGINNAKGTLAAYSPGIVGIFVGAAIIICTIYRTTEFHYEGGQPTKPSVQNSERKAPIAPSVSDSRRLPMPEEFLSSPPASGK